MSAPNVDYPTFRAAIKRRPAELRPHRENDTQSGRPIPDWEFNAA
jgi:hypothetical protein